MLIEGSRLLNYPILSLHTATEIARVKALVVDPNYLKIMAFEVVSINSRKRLFLDVNSIREFSKVMVVQTIIKCTIPMKSLLNRGILSS